MNDNEIKQLLENIEVQPSPRCWEAIESGISAAGAAAGGTAAATKAAAHATRHLSAAAVKALIVGGAATVAIAGAFIAVSFFSGSHDASSVSEPVATISSEASNTSSDESVLADSVAEVSVAHVSNAIFSETQENSPAEETAAPVPAGVNAEMPEPVTPRATDAVPSHSTSLAVSQKPVQAPVSNIANPVVPSTPSVAPQPVSHTEDPILAGRDDLDFAPPVAIEIPNVITPNGDGYNDLFIIKGIENCEKSKLIVRSQSGGVVLQISNYQNNWDAQNAPDGTYYYQLYYTIHGIEEFRTGTLTIIR